MKLLRVVDVTVDRGTTRRALDSVAIELQAGSACFVLGANGSGKSTLLRTIAGVDRPVSGHVLVDGIALASLSPRARAREISWMSQGLVAPRRVRVFDLVASARYPHRGAFARLGTVDREIVHDALRRVDLDGYAERFAHELSGGELARALLARAFAQDTDVVLLDEPTSALDPRHKLAFARRIVEWVRGSSRIAIVATHDVNLAAQVAHRIIVLDRGRVVVNGRPDDVMTPGGLACLFGEDIVIGRRFSGLADEERPWVLAWDDGPGVT
ncbi:MAG: ABC transporter ATP-binding protein [Planctomycetes bacterium]|nr:ABC transporter ATP-binding protein [Planctomycetota bacterium]